MCQRNGYRSKIICIKEDLKRSITFFSDSWGAVTWKRELAYPLFSQLCRTETSRRIYREADLN